MSDLELKHIPSDFCVFTVKDFLWGNIYSEPVENGLQLVMDIGQQREVVSKQQFWDSKIWSTSKCALYPFSQTSNIIQVERKKQGTALLHTKLWLHTCLLVPIQQCVLICVIQVLEDGE